MSGEGNGTANGSATSRGAGLADQIGQLGSTASQLISDARTTVNGLKGSLDLAGRMERHPYAMLAGALGVGYVLGGGLFSGVTFRLVRLGIKAAALPLIRGRLLELVESALAQSTQRPQSPPNVV